MPEGDVLHRTAVTLDRWMAGRRITACASPVARFPARRLVGQTVEAVESRGKHLLIRLDSGASVHTHLRMSGSWHVYSAGERWRRPEREARLVLTCDDRVAVCFNAAVVELLVEGGEQVHPGLSGLGPDVLVEPLALDEVRQRARARPPALAVGELLLDQQVVAGIGNIYRCEALFLERCHPWTPVSALSDEQLDRLVTTAARLLRASALGPGRPSTRAVYKRAGRPCPRCGTPIRSRRQGDQARIVYWCPRCQAELPPQATEGSASGPYTRRPERAQTIQRGANG